VRKDALLYLSRPDPAAHAQFYDARFTSTAAR
jgi:hypothetical protein